MAFKPFEFFRKRRRVLLALITIMAMFVFVIGDALIGSPGSGGGPLSRGIMSLFGFVPRDRVAVVGGANVTLTDLRELAAQREAAYRLVLAVREAAQDAILRKEANFTDADFRLRESPRQEDQLKFRERLENVRQSKPEVWRKLTEIRPCMVNDAVADFDFSDLQAFIQRHGRLPTEADSPLTAENLITFAWWKSRADQLGVAFNTAKVKEELLRVAGDAVPADSLPSIVRAAFRRTRQETLDLDKLLTWLGNEMRVMVAKGIVLGAERRAFFGSAPLSVQATPLDLWKAYVEVRTQLDVGILSIPVNQGHFLQQVADPTPDQVKDFYNKYRSQEPDPARDTPGFRIPKLYQIEFVYADLNPTADAGKYYHTWARAIQELDPLTFLAGIVDYYEKNKDSRYRIEEPYIVSVSSAENGQTAYYRRAPLPPADPWLDAAAAQQTEAAQAVGVVTAALASAAVGGTSFGPVLPPSGRPLPTHQAQSVELAAVVGEVAASASLSLGPTGILAYPPRLGYVEKFVPLSEAFGGIADTLTEELVHNLLEADFRKLQADLASYGETYRREYARWRARPGARADSTAKFTPPPFTFKKDGQDVAEPLDEYLKRFAETRGMLLERMDEMRSQAELLKERGKSPLGSLLKPLFFEGAFLSGKQFDDFVARKLVEAPGLFQARRVPEVEEGMPRRSLTRKYALYWKRAEAEARTPPLEEIYANVMEAWKVQQARALAEAAARDLADKAAKEGTDGYRLLVDSPLGEYTEKVLARFEPASLGVGVLNYRPAPIPTIEYPTDGFLDQVMKDLQTPGQTVVVSNKPKSAFYVLFLRERRQPRATDPLAVSEFDLQVMLPSPQRQLQVQGMPLSDWILFDRYERFIKQWNEYFKDVTRFNADVANAFKSS